MEDERLFAHSCVLVAAGCPKLKEAIEKNFDFHRDANRKCYNLSRKFVFTDEFIVLKSPVIFLINNSIRGVTLKLLNLPIVGVVAFLDFLYTGHAQIR